MYLSFPKGSCTLQPARAPPPPRPRPRHHGCTSCWTFSVRGTIHRGSSETGFVTHYVFKAHPRVNTSFSFSWLNTIPQNGRAHLVYPSSADGRLVAPPLGHYAATHMHNVVWTHTFSSLGPTPGTGNPGSGGNSTFPLLRNCQTVSTAATALDIPTGSGRRFLHFRPTLALTHLCGGVLKDERDWDGGTEVGRPACGAQRDRRAGAVGGTGHLRDLQRQVGGGGLLMHQAH